MSKTVEIKLINNQPPGARCCTYMYMAIVLMGAYRNVRMVTVPNDQREGSDPPPPAVLINNRLLKPDDNKVVSGKEFIRAVEEVGGILNKGAEPPLEKLNSVIEDFSKPQNKKNEPKIVR